jgi:hypothetical protein
MKNELMIAKRTNQPKRASQQRLLEILDQLNLNALQHRFLPT